MGTIQIIHSFNSLIFRVNIKSGLPVWHINKGTYIPL